MSGRDYLHLRAPGNWINDPNGFIYYKGEYHLYYQYFPYAPQWGTMHWGHAVSRDLVNWEHKGLALFPSKPFDRNGCFSGSAQETDRGLSFYYTGVMYNRYDKENIHLSVNDDFDSAQVMITSPDGYHFDNFHDKEMVIPPLTDCSIGSTTHTRDPKVWKEGGTYYMVLGSQSEDKDGKMQGKLLFYRSADGHTWEYAESFTDNIGGYMWECPDLFKCGDSYVLCVSPMGYLRDGHEYANMSVCVPASFDASECLLKTEGDAELIDHGMDFYAPQSTLDARGRRTIIGWMRMPASVKEKGGQEWIGMMSLPRLVENRDGHICFRPHPDVVSVFQTRADAGEIDYERPFKINICLGETDSLNIGGFRLWQECGRLWADRSHVFGDVKGYRTRFSTPPLKGKCELEVFVDKYLIEVFVNDGEYVLSNIVYGLAGPVEISHSRLSGCGSVPTGKPMVILVPTSTSESAEMVSPSF